LNKIKTISGWGIFPKINGILSKESDKTKLQERLKSHLTIIPYGNGRSYGDSALNEFMVQYEGKKHSIGLNIKTGIVDVNAGVQLGELIEYSIQYGWFLPVVPGTKFVTIGGAIAADVHGKNHHIDGCFSQHIISIDIMLADGEIIHCTINKTPELFKATCGGMGLTGVILNAKIKMVPIQSKLIEQISYKAKNIEELFSHFQKYDSKRYSVSWIDCTAKGNKLGRGILITGDFMAKGNLPEINGAKNTHISIPYFLPSWIINKFTLKIFNTFYYTISNLNDKKKVNIDYNSFFFPLDSILNWNRLYGRKGFLQYQFVLPIKHSPIGIQKILTKISQSGQGSPLAVLKLFGPENENYLSFPMKGYTLALDFKNQPKLFPLLNELDKIVIEYGGKIYLAKDARINEYVFKKGYKHIDKFIQYRKQHKMDEKFKSLQSRRIRL